MQWHSGLPNSDRSAEIGSDERQRHLDQWIHLQNCTPTEILSQLKLFSYDVPANGDCFYNAIQLYLHHIPQDPFFISIPQIRSNVAKLLTSTSTGSNILKQYHQTSQVLTTSILPSLNPSPPSPGYCSIRLRYCSHCHSAQ